MTDLEEHLADCRSNGWVVHNPLNKPEADLPVIYGFNNGGSYGFYEAVAIAENGPGVGFHICSHEGFMPGDLGINYVSNPKHETYKLHYPDGYRMEFVASADIKNHVKLNEAIRLNALLPQE